MSYLYHGHPLFDILIVGVLEPPHPKMAPLLPPIIKHLDPLAVLEWSAPMRKEYRDKMDDNGETLLQKLEWANKNIHLIQALEVRNEQLYVEFKDQLTCDCGGTMLETGYQPKLMES